MKDKKSPFSEMPIGFAMSISRNPKALYAFAEMTDARQDALLDMARQTHSKVEMEKLVDGITEVK